MPTTIRVYIDGGGTPAATGTMAADRTFSVSVPGVVAGVHTFEVTAQEDGKGESARVIQTITVERAAQATHPLAGDASVLASAAADLTAPGAPAQHALAGDASGAGTAAADLTAPGASGGALVPSNPGFESAVASTEQPAGAWWLSAAEAGTAAWEVNSPIQGARSVYLYGTGDADTLGVIADAHYRFQKSTIDASSGLLTFDIRPTAWTGWAHAHLDVRARNAAGVDLLPANRFRLGLFGDSFFGTDADLTTLMINSPATPYTGFTGLGVTVTKSLNVKDWLVSKLAVAGTYTWADVDHVRISIGVYGDMNASIGMYLDNFR